MFRWACVLLCASLPWAASAASLRRPIGVYAHVDIGDAIATYTGKVSNTSALHAYLQSFYASLLADPAISGIALGEHWDQAQPSSGTAASSFDWSYIDDAFIAATAAQKTVQLIVTPGFNSPSWLISQLPSCDPLFTTGSAPANCGAASFSNFPEEQRSDSTMLPLPWNTVYQAAWGQFLTSLNARYGSNPALVAVAIGGPVAGSDEMILPTTANTPTIQPSGLMADDTWAALIQHSFPNNASYQKTDQVFIDAWKQAIDTAESIFTGVTLFLGPDAGNDLPDFGTTSITPHADNTLFAQDCSSTINAELMSCEAKTEILSYFITVNGPNVKGTQVGGMTASSATALGSIGVPGIKLLTSLSPAPAVPFVGGAEFDKPVSGPDTESEGCPDPSGDCIGLTIEEGAYNVMAVFFDGTPAGSFYGATVGTEPIQYLDVPFNDLQYAQANSCPATSSPILGYISLQDLYARASRDLFAIAGQTTTLPALTCPFRAPAPGISLVANAEGEAHSIAPNTWVEIKGSNLAPPGDSRIWQNSDFTGNTMPTQLDNVSVTVNGKPAYVYYISPTQVNILTPPDALSGSVAVQTAYAGTSSAPSLVTAQTLSPSFFVFNGGPYVAATHLNGTLIGPSTLYPGASTPAIPGETIELYANGFGSTNVPVQAGSVTQSGTLSPLPVITIGGVSATVLFAGLVAPGQFQFNVTVPSGLSNSDQPISATYNGASTQAGTLLTVHK